MSSTVPDSGSVTKDSPKIEDGGVLTGDEAELARMGYKQELKYVQANSCILVSRNSRGSPTTRRDLTWFQVRLSRKLPNLYTC